MRFWMLNIHMDEARSPDAVGGPVPRIQQNCVRNTLERTRTVCCLFALDADLRDQASRTEAFAKRSQFAHG